MLMYCTGGIRCDIYSTLLRERGYSNLYTLKGGVAAYLREMGSGEWKGSLFTFDDRMALAAGLLSSFPSHPSHATWACPGSLDRTCSVHDVCS